MAEKSKISYEEVDDILYVGKEGKVKFSLDVSLSSGDVVIDIGFDGLVKGIEIMNASNFFGIDKKELANVKEGNLGLVYNSSYVSISVILLGVRKQISSNLVVPYSRKVALVA